MSQALTRVARWPRLRRAQRGAALLIAMLILTLVATVAAAMVWHQQRAIEVEAAERAGTQATVMLNAILDTARFFIRTLPPGTPVVNGTGIGQELKDMRLDQLLAADRNNNADTSLDAFFSAQITDAQGRYNLRRLVGDDGKALPGELAALRRLCQAVGLPAETADQLAQALGTAWSGQDDEGPLPPGRMDQLAWLGLDANVIATLRPHVDILPGRTPVNVNNATAPALVAAVDGIDAASAQILLNRRPPTGWKDLAGFRSLLPENITADDGRVAAQTRYFEVRASVRLGDRERVERWLLESRSDRANEVVVLRHSPASLIDARR
jgi:general secretion pathway protein K